MEAEAKHSQEVESLKRLLQEVSLKTNQFHVILLKLYYVEYFAGKIETKLKLYFFYYGCSIKR